MHLSREKEIQQKINRHLDFIFFIVVASRDFQYQHGRGAVLVKPPAKQQGQDLTYRRASEEKGQQKWGWTYTARHT